MKCDDIQELLPEYWDLPEHDIRRKRVDDHRRQCPDCGEQFALWQESAELIRSASMNSVPVAGGRRTSEQVMSRIYHDESWRVPVPNRIYRISYRTRKQLTLLMSFFLAVMTLSLYFAVAHTDPKEEQAFSPIMPVASAGKASSNVSLTSNGAMLEGVPIASISDPLVLTLGPVESDPNYWLVLSLLGLVSTLLVMNWLSRIRA